MPYSSKKDPPVIGIKRIGAGWEPIFALPKQTSPPVYTPPTTYTPTTKTGKRGKTTFLDPFTKWPRKDAQSKGIKETWGRRFRRKPGRRGAPAAAGKKIYVAR